MDMTPMQVVVIAALGLTGAVGLLLRRLRRLRLRELEPVQEMPSPRERLSAELRDAPRQQARRAIEDHPLDSAPPLPERFVVEPESGPELESTLDFESDLESQPSTCAASQAATQPATQASSQASSQAESFIGVASSAEPATLEHARLRCAELELLLREKDDEYRHAQALERAASDRDRTRLQARLDAARAMLEARDNQLGDINAALQEDESVDAVIRRADSAREGQQVAEDKVRELELLVAEHGEWFSHQRAELISLNKEAQERAMGAEREVALVREENARHVETLRSQQVAMRALQASTGDLERTQRSLVEAELALATASEEHKALEQAAESDIKAAMIREQNAKEKVRSLEEQVRQDALTAEHASAAVEHALALEAEASALSAQVDELRREVEARDRRIAELKVEEDASRMTSDQLRARDSLNRELESSRARVEQLRTALDAAQQRVERAGETDLELRRLRSEIVALEARQARPRSDAATMRVTAAENTVVESQRESSTPTDQPKDSTAGVRVARKRLFDTPAERDDLKMIKGIGPVMERVLNDLGVTTFEQIAAFTEDDVARVTEAINTFPGRIERDDWIGGARKACEEKNGMSVDT